MALREVLQFPDKRLREMSQPVSEVTDDIRALAQDMLDVMYDLPAIEEPVKVIINAGVVKGKSKAKVTPLESKSKKRDAA